MQIPSHDALSVLTGPVDPARFLRDHWERRSLYMPGAGRAWPFTFDHQRFFSALAASPHVKVAFRDEQGQHREVQITADQAQKMYQAGLSICAAHLEKGDEDLKAFVDELGRSVAPYGQFNLNSYLSPSDKGFGIHFDNHSVWVLQVEGTKRWFYADEPEIRAPITNCVYPLSRPSLSLPWYDVPHPDGAVLHEVVLTPGDVLYIPAGTWHKTQASGPSLSLTLAQNTPSASQYILGVLAAAALMSDEGRQFVPPILRAGDASDAADPFRTAIKGALDMLRTEIDRIDVDQLANLRLKEGAPPPQGEDLLARLLSGSR